MHVMKKDVCSDTQPRPKNNWWWNRMDDKQTDPGAWHSFTNKMALTVTNSQRLIFNVQPGPTENHRELQRIAENYREI